MDEGKVKTAQERGASYKRRRLTTVALVAFILATLWSSVAVREFFPKALPYIIQISFLIVFQVIQMVAYFGFLMYFLSSTRTEKIMPGDAKSVTLTDYKGQPVILERARYLVRVLEGYGNVRAMGGEPPKGVLLVGGPGTGKTWLAQCLAGEANVPYFLLDSSGLVSMFLGMGSIKVRRFFSTLKKYAKRYGAAVAFLDEVDAIGAARGGVEGQMGMMGGMRGMFGGGMGVLNTILSCMDGLEGPSGIAGWLKKKFYGWLGLPLPKPDYCILVMASTNRPSVLDAALTRSGRFDMVLRVTPPTTKGLREVIEYYLAQVAAAPEIDTRRVASALRGATPADIRTAVKRNAVVYAEQAGRDCVTERDIYQGAWETILGIEMPDPEPFPRDQQLVAIHEAGHAIMTMALFPELRVLLATITPHAGTGRLGATLGVVIPRLAQERQSLPLDFLARRIMLSMGGREAAGLSGRPELGFLGDRRNIQATVETMVAEGAFGYGPSIAMGASPLGGSPMASLPGNTKKAINEFLDRCAKLTRRVLRENEGALEAFAALLREHGTVTADQIEDFMGQHEVKPPESLGWLFEEVLEVQEVQGEG